MKSFLETTLNEKKDHIINRLKNLSQEEKDLLINFFDKNPHLEREINWNNKNLKFIDFKEVLDTVSKTRIKKNVRTKGISGLREGRDYIDVTDIFEKEGYTFSAYAPLNHTASKLIASSKIGKCTGKWCTAANDPYHWNVYTRGGIVLIYIIHTDGDKTAIASNLEGQIELFDAQDNSHTGSDRSINFERILRKNTSLLKHISSKIEILPPEWYTNGKKKNDKWHYGMTGNVFIMDSGEWLAGSWEGGVASKDVIWHNGTFENGTFRGKWLDGVFKNGFFEGEWHKGQWRGGEWVNGSDANGIKKSTNPNYWKMVDGLVEQLAEYFSFDDKTIQEMVKRTPFLGRTILDGCIRKRIQPITPGSQMMLSLGHTGYEIKNAIIYEFGKQLEGYEITFIGCKIFSCYGEVYFENCTIEQGEYKNVWDSIFQSCTFKNNITLMIPTDKWENRDNTFACNKIVFKHDALRSKPTLTFTTLVKNAVFDSFIVEGTEFINCEFNSCWVDGDKGKTEFMRCKMDHDTKVYNNG